MTNSEDILEAAKALWSGDGTLTTLVTGGLVHGRVKQDAGSPYASVDVDEGPLQRVAGGRYLQTFTVSLRIWDEAGTADAGPILAAVDEAFDITAITTIGLPSGRTVKLLRSFRQPGKLEEDPATKAGQSVKVGSAKYEWLIEAER